VRKGRGLGAGGAWGLHGRKNAAPIPLQPINPRRTFFFSNRPYNRGAFSGMGDGSIQLRDARIVRSLHAPRQNSVKPWDRNGLRGFRVLPLYWLVCEDRGLVASPCRDSAAVRAASGPQTT
jgi:hypothetical protein